MIFLDANVFLRFLIEPETPELRKMMLQASRLMERIAKGDLIATTSDAVVAEVFYLLIGNEYRMPFATAISSMKRILNMKGLVSSQKTAWLMALAIWSERPTLGFVDSLGAAYSLIENHQLATFDRKLARHPGLSLLRPEDW